MTQPIKNLLNNQPELRALLQKTAQLDQLQRTFAAALPAPLRPYCHVSGYRFTTLLVACDNTTVAAKLRQLGPEISLSMQSKGQKVNGIHARVQVQTARPPAQVRTRHLSPCAQQALRQLHDSMHDCPLKSALHRILMPQP